LTGRLLILKWATGLWHKFANGDTLYFRPVGDELLRNRALNWSDCSVAISQASGTTHAADHTSTTLSAGVQDNINI